MELKKDENVKFGSVEEVLEGVKKNCTSKIFIIYEDEKEKRVKIACHGFNILEIYGLSKLLDSSLVQSQ